MNAIQFENNYYTSVEGVKLYIDYVSNRLKICEYDDISEMVLKAIVSFAKQESLGKIIANCRERHLKIFQHSGFVAEGAIDGFFKGKDAICISCFLEPERAHSKHRQAEDEIVKESIIKGRKGIRVPDESFVARNAEAGDIPQLTAIFSSIFNTYPSPVFSSDYLRKVMNREILFKVAVLGDKIVSVASADMDRKNMNAEITDCATYPEYRGKGLLTTLVQSLEKDLKAKGFHSLYSLSRAINHGINKSLGRLDYKYSGRLINNCNICGGFEDMNIWVKII